MHVTAILVAGGPGQRLGGSLPKAFVPIDGVPLILRTMRAVVAAPEVTAAVAVVPQGWKRRGETLFEGAAPWRVPIRVTEGGAERQDSVRAGIEASGETDLIAIHDAARPFVDVATVSAVIAAAAREGAALAGVPAIDTIKQVGSDGSVVATPDREVLWLAQTPQAFRAELIRKAHARATAEGIVAATDDSFLVERIGGRVSIVRGNSENRKITTRDDLQWAEWLLTGGRAPR